MKKKTKKKRRKLKKQITGKEYWEKVRFDALKAMINNWNTIERIETAIEDDLLPSSKREFNKFKIWIIKIREPI